MTDFLKTKVVPDRIDLRDRLYQPPPDVAPPPSLEPSTEIAILHQGDTFGCTGFALAAAIHVLQQRAPEYDQRPVSPYMLYNMARRYDEFAGENDRGSSIRGVLKGWYKHGACARELWPDLKMPRPAADEVDWWFEAAKRPMGAYYRVEKKSVVDMQVALARVGCLAASIFYHDGWREGLERRQVPNELWVIPQRRRDALAGHAFAIIGYTAEGFIIQNSYGEDWGSKGLAILTYSDWLDNGMDCWVAQLGVMTEDRRSVAAAGTLRPTSARSASISLSSDTLLANQEIDDFIVNVENNGRLSQTGQFRSTDLDLDLLIHKHLPRAQDLWGTTGDPIDVAIYAHGGLVGEKAAAAAARLWIPALFNARILPVFLMWETDILSTITNRVRDLLGVDRVPAAGLLETLDEIRLRAIEQTVRRPGKVLWDEMKQNARRISENSESGLRLLIRKFAESGRRGDQLRLHLIGHSAGAIVHSHLIHFLASRGFVIETATFLAGAARLDLFQERVLPHLRNGRVRKVTTVNLTESQERADPSTRAILGYDRSLLYLVSNAFEDNLGAPLLGLEKDLRPAAASWGLPKPQLRLWQSSSQFSQAARHGGFSRDRVTRESVVQSISRWRETVTPVPTVMLSPAPAGSERPRGEEVDDRHLAWTVEVRARRRWNDTRIVLQQGRRYRFQLRPDDDWKDWFVPSGPEGYELAYLRPLEPRLRVPKIGDEKVPFFALVGCIGKSYRHAFRIAAGQEVAAPATGRLYCFANDLSCMYWNNSGSVSLSIQPLS
ncbi:MAG: C1 family peptidase [Thermoanaerobaculia bacterium]|nr:C1 family peptidase [Thermoanaerobaculia bacterium]